MEYLEHIASPGERWDQIAYKYYGDAKLISPILLANAEHLGSPLPLVFEAKTPLRIPILPQDEVAQAQLPPWKRTNS